MALSYAVGSAVGLNNVFDALSTFLQGAGWSLAETVNTRDLIFKSTGIDGKSNMVYRISASTVAAANPIKFAGDAHQKFPWIFVQGYNAWTVGSPGTGSKPYGQVGPWAFGNQIVSANPAADTARVHRYNGTFPLTATADVALLGRTRRVKTADSYENAFHLFDGRRKMVGVNTSQAGAQMGWCDITHGESNFGSGGIASGLATSGVLPCLVHDPVTDKDFIYVLNNTATLAQQWLRYDIEANTWATMAAPTWTASATASACCVWDGNDTIYAHHGNSTAEFAKYSISGNSWTNLTASPVNRQNWTPSSGSGANTMIYVPNSISGIGEDVIYILLAGTGTVIYRYDVTANAWRSTSGTGALTAPQTIAASSMLWWDRVGKIYYAVPNTAPSTWYTSNCTTPNTWTSMGAVQTTQRQYSGMCVLNHIPAKVRVHSSLTTNYWFLGDADAVTVVVKINTGTPHYYWMTFGKFSASNRADIMTTTATISPGGRVTITVDDTSKYSAGEPVLIWNPSNGNVERSLIFDITGATTFRANVSGSYPIGTRIGIDPTPWMAAGNGMALCPTDAQGNGSDNETAQYFLEPLPDASASNRSSPGVRGLYQPLPIAIFNTETTTAKYENRGFCKYVFSMSTGAYPALQAEEMVKIAGKTYVFFTDTETARYSVDTRGILIGPID